MNIKRYLAAVLIIASFNNILSANIADESGNFVDEIERLKDLAFLEASSNYVAPTSGQQTSFATMITNLYNGNHSTANTLAAALNYEIVKYTDTNTSNIFYGAREVLSGGAQQTGWGSYFVRSNAQRAAVIQAPHLLHDTRTWQVAALAFNSSGSKGFMLAGAHRDANGEDTADVAHLENSIFQTVHETWTDLNTSYVSYSIHGYNGASATHAAFPAGSDAVLSNGTGLVSQEVIDLDAKIDAAGYDSYAYNTLDVSAADNVTVNETIVGSTFSTLGATLTEQRIYSSSVNSTFVHVELEQSLRLMGDVIREEIAGIISSSIIASTTLIPEPVHFSLVIGLLLLLSIKLSESKKYHGKSQSRF